MTFAKSGVTANWDDDLESILALAEKNGLRPDFGCRSGICHTCACELIEGEVEYVSEPLDHPDAGKVLICCARPKGNVVVGV